MKFQYYWELFWYKTKPHNEQHTAKQAFCWEHKKYDKSVKWHLSHWNYFNNLKELNHTSREIVLLPFSHLLNRQLWKVKALDWILPKIFLIRCDHLDKTQVATSNTDQTSFNPPTWSTPPPIWILHHLPIFCLHYYSFRISWAQEYQ